MGWVVMAGESAHTPDESIKKLLLAAAYSNCTFQNSVQCSGSSPAFVTQRGDCEQGYLFASSPTLA